MTHLLAESRPPFNRRSGSTSTTLPIVRRDHLLKIIFASDRPAKIIVLDASAGYGKTALLHQIFQRRNHYGAHVGWVSSDGPRTLEQFSADIAAALDVTGQNAFAPDRPTSLSAGLEALKRQLEAQLRGVERRRSLTLLLFDDCEHRITDEMAPLFAHLILKAPRNMRLVLAGRGDIPLKLSAHELVGDLLRLKAHDLCFRRDEIIACLRGAPEGYDVQKLIERTEGWPVAVQLMRLSLMQEHRRTDAVSDLSGRSDTLVNYFNEVVFRDLDAETKDVLLRTCILERFDGDLINQILGRADGWRIVESLVSRGLFVMVAENNPSRYRYHPIFAEFLRERLRRERPGLEGQLRIQAAGCFARLNRINEAVEQADAAGDAELAIKFLEGADGMNLIMRGGPIASNKLEALTAAKLHEHPKVMLALVYKRLLCGRAESARKLYDLMDVSDIGAFSLADRLQYDLFHAMVCRSEHRAFSEDHQRAFENLLSNGPPLDEVSEALLLLLLTSQAYARHDYPKVWDLAHRLETALDGLDSPYLGGYSRVCLGLLSLNRGDPMRAQVFYRDCLRSAEERLAPNSVLVRTARVFIAQAQFELGNAHEASILLEPYLDSPDVQMGWYEVYEAAYPVAAHLLHEKYGIAHCLHALNLARQAAEDHGRRLGVNLLAILKVRELARAGLIADAVAAAQSADLKTYLNIADDQGPPTSPLFFHAIDAHFRLDLARGGLARWPDRLRRLMVLTDASRNARWSHHFAVLLAVTSERLANGVDAEHTLSAAMRFAEGSGMVRALKEWASELAPITQRLSTRRPVAPRSDHMERFASLGDGELSRINSCHTNSASPRLNRREHEVLELLSTGLTTKEMAHRLTLSDGTIKGYRKSLFQKLNVSTRSRAIAEARSFRLIE